jgi:hypothetical protein
MLLAGSPLLEDLAQQSELLVWLRGREVNNARRHGVEQLARTVFEMGVLERMPFQTQPSPGGMACPQPGRRDRRPARLASVDAEVV